MHCLYSFSKQSRMGRWFVVGWAQNPNDNCACYDFKAVQQVETDVHVVVYGSI